MVDRPKGGRKGVPAENVTLGFMTKEFAFKGRPAYGSGQGQKVLSDPAAAEPVEPVISLRDIQATLGGLVEQVARMSARLDALALTQHQSGRIHERAEERSLSDDVDAAFDRAMSESGEALESQIIARNIEMRRAYLDAVETLGGIDIHYRTGRLGSNPSEPASRWRREKRIFGVKAGNAFRYPAFQFDASGEPLCNVKDVLKALPEDMSDWNIAFWFQTPNVYLDVISPKDLLSKQENRDALIEAARHEGLPMAG